MAFPDSSKKAPNVFVDVNDGTGAPSSSTSTGSSGGTKVVKVPLPPPTTDFVGTPLVGDAPLSVAFTDLSTGSPTSWQWDFENDGIVDSIQQNPTWIYATPGTYSVKLTAFNQYGADIEVKTAYITVNTPIPPVPPVADFTATPLTGIAPLLVQFTDLSTGTPTAWQWDFEDDGIVDSIAQHPAFTYTAPGTYSVKLTVYNGAGNDSETKIAYITVTGTPPSCPLPSSVENADTIDLWHFNEGIGATEIAATISYDPFSFPETLSGSFVLGPAETNCGTALYTGNTTGNQIQLLSGPGLF